LNCEAVAEDGMERALERRACLLTPEQFSRLRTSQRLLEESAWDRERKDRISAKNSMPYLSWEPPSYNRGHDDHQSPARAAYAAGQLADFDTAPPNHRAQGESKCWGMVGKGAACETLPLPRRAPRSGQENEEDGELQIEVALAIGGEKGSQSHCNKRELILQHLHQRFSVGRALHGKRWGNRFCLKHGRSFRI